MIWLRILGWVKTALRALAVLVTRYPLQAALIALLCLSGWLWHGKREAMAERDAARAEIIAQAKAFKAAQVEAARKAREARAATEQKYEELADEADTARRDLDVISRRALGLRAQRSCSTSGAAAASMHQDSGGDTGTDTGGVYFTAAEAEALRRHEVRSTVCEGWARGLIEAGLAVGE